MINFDTLIGSKVAFTYTRQTDKGTGREGETTQRVGYVVETGANRKTGDPFVKVDCGDTDRFGQPMPKTFRQDAVTDLRVVTA